MPKPSSACVGNYEDEAQGKICIVTNRDFVNCSTPEVLDVWKQSGCIALIKALTVRANLYAYEALTYWKASLPFTDLPYVLIHGDGLQEIKALARRVGEENIVIHLEPDDPNDAYDSLNSPFLCVMFAIATLLGVFTITTCLLKLYLLTSHF